MPETAIDEDAGAESYNRQIRSARQGLGMDAVTKAMTEQETTHKHLGSRVLRPDSAHAVTALFGCHLVSHITLVFVAGKPPRTDRFYCFSVMYFQ